MTHRFGAAVARGLIFLIQLYRHTISPLRLPTCRFTPTCSQYAVEALGAHGLVKGGWLALVRLAKCGPWHRGGWDPIPERRDRAPQRCASTTGSAATDAADDAWGNPASRLESETRV